MQRYFRGVGGAEALKHLRWVNKLFWIENATYIPRMYVELQQLCFGKETLKKLYSGKRNSHLQYSPAHAILTLQFL